MYRVCMKVGRCQSSGERLRIQVISIKIGICVIYATSVLFSTIKMGASGLGFNLANHFYELFLKS